MSNIRNNSTINYYNLHAKEYFETTVNTDVSECCERFLKYLTPGDSIIDIGAGSGRDIHFFQSRGYIVDGIDASSELCKIASDYTGVVVVVSLYPFYIFVYLILVFFKPFTCR